MKIFIFNLFFPLFAFKEKLFNIKSDIYVLEYHFMKKKFLLSFLLCSFFICGCSQKSDDDDDDDDILITQPITNNPLIVPNHGSGIPGMPTLPGQNTKPGGLN